MIATAPATEPASARRADPRVAVVMITMNRRDEVLTTLPRLLALPEQPRVVLVDNGSTDGTVAAVRARVPEVDVIALPHNEGAAARTAGVLGIDAPYVAFADDDSWWAPGALGRAADLLDAHPRLALVQARILLGDDERLEPACAEMAASPLPRPRGWPGPALLGFIACGAIVRREAYLEAGGFHAAFGVGGEEELLAADLATRGWGLACVEEVVAHHHPSPVRDRDRRRRVVTRNALWFAWLRRPLPAALAHTAGVLWTARCDRAVCDGLVEAVRGLPWVLRGRRPVSGAVEDGLRMLGSGGAPPAPTTAPAEVLDASVVIPTYQRDDTLQRTLDAVAAQQFAAGRWEIIVVDDARSETTPRTVAAWAARHPGLAVRTLPGGARGPATARNVGWRAARGRVIAFIDDDAYPADHRWLAEGVACFDDETVGAVSGRTVVPLDGTPTDYQRNVQGLERGEFITANAFYRRQALLDVGGFDEGFTAPYREDSDLQYRVDAAGWRMVKQPAAVVIHPAPVGRFAVSLRLQRNSRFNARMYRKHPARYRRDLEPRPPLPYYATCAAALLAAGAAVSGHRHTAALAAVAWAAQYCRFLARRLRGTSKQPRHVADMALTSALIPWLSVYWRLRGAWDERTPFW